MTNNDSNESEEEQPASFADTPSARKMRQDMEQFGLITNVYKVLRFFGYRNDAMERVLAQFKGLARQTKELITLIDEFNAVFLQQGWISHESMNVGVVRRTLETHKANGLQAAEQVLVNHYEAEALRFIEMLFTPIKEFEPRKELFRLASEDYIAERYHACIPVQLLLIDGLVDDLCGKGFFADGTPIEAWDSIAGHSEGLQRLSKLFRTSRNRTNAEELTIPYRNGILHGRDLGYARRIIAAKLWAALQAVADFARAKYTESRRKLDAPVLLADLSPEERTAVTRESSEYLRAHFAWRARSAEQLSAIPSSGEPEQYAAGSPERALVEFLLYWKEGNYGNMTELIVPTDKQSTHGNRAGQTRVDFQDHKLMDFKIIQVEDSLAAMAIITCQLTAEHSDTTATTDHKFFMEYCSDRWETLPAGAKHGRWVVQNLVFPCVMFSGNNPLSGG